MWTVIRAVFRERVRSRPWPIATPIPIATPTPFPNLLYMPPACPTSSALTYTYSSHHPRPTPLILNYLHPNSNSRQSRTTARTPWQPRKPKASQAKASCLMARDRLHCLLTRGNWTERRHLSVLTIRIMALGRHPMVASRPGLLQPAVSAFSSVAWAFLIHLVPWQTTTSRTNSGMSQLTT